MKSPMFAKHFPVSKYQPKTKLARTKERCSELRYDKIEGECCSSYDVNKNILNFPILFNETFEIYLLIVKRRMIAIINRRMGRKHNLWTVYHDACVECRFFYLFNIREPRVWLRSIQCASTLTLFARSRCIACVIVHRRKKCQTTC